MISTSVYVTQAISLHSHTCNWGQLPVFIYPLHFSQDYGGRHAKVSVHKNDLICCKGTTSPHPLVSFPPNTDTGRNIHGNFNCALSWIHLLSRICPTKSQQWLLTHIIPEYADGSIMPLTFGFVQKLFRPCNTSFHLVGILFEKVVCDCVWSTKLV